MPLCFLLSVMSMLYFKLKKLSLRQILITLRILCLSSLPRQDQSGKNDRKGLIKNECPSMLRYLLIIAAHTIIKYSKKMKKKYLSLVRRIGKSRAIVAISRILAETIFNNAKKRTLIAWMK